MTTIATIATKPCGCPTWPAVHLPGCTVQPRFHHISIDVDTDIERRPPVEITLRIEGDAIGIDWCSWCGGEFDCEWHPRHAMSTALSEAVSVNDEDYCAEDFPARGD